MSIQYLIDEFGQRVANYTRNVQEPSQWFFDAVKDLNGAAAKQEINLALQKLQQMEKPYQNSDYILWLQAAQAMPSTEYLPYLYSFFNNDHPYIWHEGIIYIFMHLINEPDFRETSTPVLKKVLAYDFDLTYQMPLKILNLLARINTKDTWEIVYAHKDSHIEELREEAEYLIAHK